MPVNQNPDSNTKLEIKLTEQNLLIFELQKELELDKRKIKKLDSELDNLKHESALEIKFLQNDLEKYKNEAKRLQNNAEKDFDQRISAEISRVRGVLSQEVASYKKQNELLSNRIAELFERDVAHDAEHKTCCKLYEERIFNLRKTVDDIKEQELKNKEILKSELEALNDRLNTSGDIQHQLEDELTNAFLEIDSLKERLKKTESDHEKEIRDMKDSRELLVDSHNSELDHLGKALVKLNTLMSSFFSDSETDEDVGSAAEVNFNFLMEIIRKLNFHFDALSEQISLLFNDNKNLLDENNKLKENQEEIGLLRKELDELTNALQKQKNLICPQTPSNESLIFMRQDLRATSTPFPCKVDFQGGGEPMPRRNIDVLNWMEQCQILDSENKKLKIKIQDLELKLQDSEYTTNIVKEELANFQIRTTQLEHKLSDYSDLAKKHTEITDQFDLVQIKLKEMTEQKKLLEEQNEKLSQENLDVEKYKFPESVSDSQIINDLNEKIKEVVCLKCENKFLSEQKNSLVEKTKKLNEIRNLYVLKIEEISRELYSNKEDFEHVFQEKIKLMSKNQILEKEIEILNMKVQHLINIRENDLSSSTSLVEKLQKELLSLIKEAMNKNTAEDFLETDLDARHESRLIKKLNVELTNEKDELLQKILDQKRLLTSYQKNQGLDEGWLLHLDKLENDLLSEIKDHKEHYARIEEALRNTGKLLDELQCQKNDLRIKNQEVAKIESKLKKTEMQLQISLKKIETNEAILKEEIEGRKNLEERLKVAQTDLADASFKLSIEKKKNELVLKHMQLENDNIELENNLNRFCEENDKIVSKNEKVFREEFLSQAEIDYTKAVKIVQHHFESQYAQNVCKNQEEHKNQVENLNRIIKEQAQFIEKAVGKMIISLLGVEHFQNLNVQNLLDTMEKHKNELKNFESKLTSSDLEIFNQVKTSLQESFNCQLLLAEKILKEEHDKHYEISFETLKQLHKEEISLLKLQHEADKFDSEKDVIEPKTTIDYLKLETKINVSDVIKNLVLNTFFNSLDEFLKDWNSKYKKEIKELKNILEKGFTNSDDEKIDEIMKINENNLLKKSSLIESSKEFIQLLKSFKQNLIKDVNKTVEILHDKTQQCFDNLKYHHEKINNLLILEDKLRKVQSEKENLEKQYRSVIHLLESDHESDVARTNKLLDDFKRVCEGSVRTETLLSLRAELEEKYKKEADELRIYFERKVAELEKNYSDEVFSQNSRKISLSSSCSEGDLISEKLFDAATVDKLSNKKLNIPKEFEDLIIDEMGSNLADKTLSKVKNEMFDQLKAHLESDCKEKFQNLSKEIENRLLRICEYAGNQEEKLSQLKSKINTLNKALLNTQEDKENFRRETLETFLHNLTMVLNGEKNLDSSIYVEKGIEIFENVYSKKLESRRNFKTSLESVAESEVLKERDNLKALHFNLKDSVKRLMAYINASDDSLMQDMMSEIRNICDENLSVENINFETSVSTLIRELDETNFSDGIDLDESSRNLLEPLLKKLKNEAMYFLKISDPLQKENAFLKHHNDQLLKYIRSKNDKSVFEAGYSEYDSHTENLFNLQKEAQNMLSDLGKKYTCEDLLKIVEKISRDGDVLLEKMIKERDSLNAQLIAADNKIQSMKRFLEDQTAERESEREEYVKELTCLKEQLKEKGKECSILEMTNTEVKMCARKAAPVPNKVEELSEELRNNMEKLKETLEERDSLKDELKETINKIWQLREIITNLETQLNSKHSDNLNLQKQVEDMHNQIKQQSGAQSLMAEELESLRNISIDESFLNKLQELEEKHHFNSSHIRHFRIQIQDMEKLVEEQTKELEALNVAASTNSLSSPSEEISVRDYFRSVTPEHCPSPVSFPVKEVDKLYDLIRRHARSDQVLIKKVKDQDIRIQKLTNYIEEVQGERDILQKQCEKQLAQIAEKKNKIDDLRHKVDAAHASVNRDLMTKIQHLEEQKADLQQLLDVKNNQINEKEKKLQKAEEHLLSRNVDFCDNEALDSVRIELAEVIAEKNKLHDLVDKYKREKLRFEKYLGDAEVIKSILDDKNEDIDHLQKTIALLQTQNSEEEEKSCKNNKNLKVSFAADVISQGSFSESSRLRDAPKMSPTSEPIPFFFNQESPTPIAQSTVLREPMKNISIQSIELPEKIREEDISFDTIEKLSLELAEKNDEIVRLENDLAEKDGQIVRLKNEVESFKKVTKDLENTKIELQMAVESVDEDKDFYEKQLLSLTENLRQKEAEIILKNETISSKEKEIIKKVADAKALQNLLNKVQKKVKESETIAENYVSKAQIENLIEENEKLKIEIQKLQSEIKEIHEKFNYEHSLNEQLGKEITELINKNIICDTKIENLSKENEKLLINLQFSETKLDSILNSLRNIDCEEPDEIEEINMIRSEIKHLKTQLEGNSSEKRLQNTIEDLKRINENNRLFFQNEIDVLQKSVETLKNNEKLAVQNFNSALTEKELLCSQLASLQEEFEKLQFQNDEKLDCTEEKQIGVLENLLISKLEVEKRLKMKVNDLEKRCNDLIQVRQQEEVRAEKMERLRKNQEKAINQLTVRLEEQKSKNLTLELSVENLKAALRRSEEAIEEVRAKSRKTQKEDIELLETMRNRLKVLMENECHLKKLILDEKQKNEYLEGQLNSRKIMEKYQSDSENDDSLHKKDKYELLVHEVEKLKIHNEDLQIVLSRERNALSSLKNDLHKVQQDKISLNAEVQSLLNELKLEKNKLIFMEEKLKKINGSNQNINHELYEKTIATAQSVIRDLEQECNDLKNHIKSQQEQGDKWREDVYSPLVNQLTKLNSMIEKLMKDRGNLETYVVQLKEERKDLERELENLKKITKSPVEPKNLVVPKADLGRKVTTVFSEPVLSGGVQNYLDRCMRAESHRKSLVHQKKVLLVFLEGYQRAEKADFDIVIPGFFPFKKPIKFKTVALTVLGMIKMSRFTETRKIRRLLTFRKIVEAIDSDYRLKNPDNDAFSRVPYSPSRVPHSPPCRDRDTYRQRKTGQSEYLACFDQLQQRLDEAVRNVQS